MKYESEWGNAKVTITISAWKVALFWCIWVGRLVLVALPFVFLVMMFAG